MVGSRQIENPFYRDIGRKRGREFSALVQVIRIAIAFLREYIVPAAKRLGADLLVFALPEIAEVVGRRKNFKKERGQTNSEKTVGS